MQKDSKSNKTPRVESGRVPWRVRWFLIEYRLQNFGPPFRKKWYHRAVCWVGDAIYKVRRYLLAGARPVRCERPTDGYIHDDDIFIVFSGNCPIQGDGIIDGRVCYYRSRGSGWQFHVAREGSDDALAWGAWEYDEDKYFWPDGGWVHQSVSQACIRKAAAIWRAAGRP